MNNSTIAWSIYFGEMKKKMQVFVFKNTIKGATETTTYKKEIERKGTYAPAANQMVESTNVSTNYFINTI